MVIFPSFLAILFPLSYFFFFTLSFIYNVNCRHTAFPDFFFWNKHIPYHLGLVCSSNCSPQVPFISCVPSYAPTKLIQFLLSHLGCKTQYQIQDIHNTDFLLISIGNRQASPEKGRFDYSYQCKHNNSVALCYRVYIPNGYIAVESKICTLDCRVTLFKLILAICSLHKSTVQILNQAIWIKSITVSFLKLK